jgi:hypothetical protein
MKKKIEEEIEEKDEDLTPDSGVIAPTVNVIRRAAEKRVRENLSKPLQIFGLDHAAESLAVSAFMRPWVVEQIKTALEKGQIFEMRDPTSGESVITYKLATQEDMIEAATSGVKQSRVGDAPAKTRRGDETVFRFSIPPAGKKRDKAFEDMPEGAKSMLEVIAACGREELNTSALEAVLEAGRDKLAFKGKTPLLVRFKEALRYKDKPIAAFVEEVEEVATENEED